MDNFIPFTDEDLSGELKNVQLVLREYVCFRLGFAWYGLPVLAVREVVKCSRITPLPALPPFVLGIFSLRGSIVSVTDLRPVLGVAAPLEILNCSRLVVVEVGKLETALLVDEVLQVIAFAEDDLEPPLATSGAGGKEVVEYLARLGDKLIALLSMDKLLDRLVLDAQSDVMTKEKALR